MTEHRAFRRRYRGAASVEHVPEQLAQWFAGEIAETWYRILPYEVTLLPSRWRAWKAEHAGANRPPPGYEWLNDEGDERHPNDDEVREARRMLARDL